MGTSPVTTQVSTTSTVARAWRRRGVAQLHLCGVSTPQRGTASSSWGLRGSCRSCATRQNVTAGGRINGTGYIGASAISSLMGTASSAYSDPGRSMGCGLQVHRAPPASSRRPWPYALHRPSPERVYAPVTALAGNFHACQSELQQPRATRRSSRRALANLVARDLELVSRTGFVRSKTTLTCCHDHVWKARECVRPTTRFEPRPDSDDDAATPHDEDVRGRAARLRLRERRQATETRGGYRRHDGTSSTRRSPPRAHDGHHDEATTRGPADNSSGQHAIRSRGTAGRIREMVPMARTCSPRAASFAATSRRASVRPRPSRRGCPPQST